jgi:hypothetical protein
MTIRKLLITAGALVIGLAAVNPTAVAQGPLYDKVLVNLPYTITIGERVLQPGDYTIRQLPSAADSRVLLIYSDNGMKFETSAMTIPTLDNRTPDDTKVILHHFGNDYYFDKIWIQGKNYGYEFPLPDAVKARERERAEPMTVAATYESVPAESGVTETTTTAQATTTDADRAAQEERDRLAREQAEKDRLAAEQAERDRLAAEQAERDRQAQQAQAQPPAAVEPAPAEPAPVETASADRQAEMPDTAANWLLMLLGGGVISSAGLALRRR